MQNRLKWLSEHRIILLICIESHSHNLCFYFCIFSSAEKSLILDVIFNTNFEIDNQKGDY